MAKFVWGSCVHDQGPWPGYRLKLLAVALLLCAGPVCLPQTNTSPASQQMAQPAGPTTIAGQTVNAINGQPLARVLVNCGNQAVLTDFEGRFQFSIDGGANATLRARKPGFWATEDPMESSSMTLRAPFPATPVTIKLYPEAILTGTVTGPDGDPLSGVFVEAWRSLYDDSGHRWIRSTSAQTNSHGDFRLPVQAGEYRIETRYLPLPDSDTQVVLPVAFPGGSSSNSSSLIEIEPGQTQHIDLHPQVASLTAVLTRFEPDSGRGRARVLAVSADGTEITVRETPTSTPGEVRLEVPRGTFTLEARRMDNPDNLEEAAANVTVGDREIHGLVLHFNPVSSLPVDLSLDSSVTSDNAPDPTQLGLILENLDSNGDAMDQRALHLRVRGNLPPVFTPTPGSYRLRALGNGSWYIVSANYGSSDLLSQPLTIAPGVGSTPIRLVVSNQMATLSGTVTQGDQPATGWIYLVATTPSATPVLSVHVGADGSYSRSLPPGSYRAVAFEYRHGINFEDPAVLSSFANDFQTVSLAPGDKQTLSLQISPYPGSH